MSNNGPSRRRRRGSAAFSLIEVMVAGSIFIIGLAAMFSAFRTASNQFEHQRHVTYGLHVTEATLEELLVRQLGDPLLNGGGPVLYDARGFLTTVPAQGRYSVSWTSQPNVPLVGLRTISVTTSWAEAGITRSVTLSTQRN